MIYFKELPHTIMELWKLASLLSVGQAGRRESQAGFFMLPF